MDLRYLDRKKKEADDKKHLLVKQLYGIGDLAYVKSSRRGDYELQDLVKDVHDELHRYYATVKLFDPRVSGANATYEEIIVFFMNNVFETFVLGDRIRWLKEMLFSLKDDTGVDSPGRAEVRNISRTPYLIDLEGKVKQLEVKLTMEIMPRLREFVNDINIILYCEKVLSLIERSACDIAFFRGGEGMVSLKNFTITYVWMNSKIQPAELTRKKITHTIAETINQTGLGEMLSSMAGITEAKMSGFIERIADEFQIHMKDDFEVDDRADDESAPELGEAKHDEYADAVTQLKLLLRGFSKVRHPSRSLFLPEFASARYLADAKEQRYLFNVSGSYDVSLKTVGDYLSNSLLFVFYWLEQHIKKNPSQAALYAPLVACAECADRFLRVYATALEIAAETSNQSETFLRGEILQYVPVRCAAMLIGLIQENCIRVEEAFVECIGRIARHAFKGQQAVLKQVDIVQDSFIDAEKKISREMSRLRG